jgi:transcriptional regulator with XRE-family HTH domain
VKDLRAKRRLSAEGLADAMREVGVPFDKTVIANLETGRRRFVTVQELLALAYVLDVAPTHLLVPTDGTGDEVYLVTPTYGSTVTHVRHWIRGQQPIGPQDARTYFTEVPLHEFAVKPVEVDDGER